MPDFLCLDGTMNGLYVTLAQGYRLGYYVPDSATAAAWLYEPVLMSSHDV